MQNIIIGKGGVSQVIFSVFIIIIAIISVSILFLSINKIIKPSLSPELSCIDLQIKKPILIKNACYNSKTEDIEITINRQINDQTTIKQITFLISSNEKNEKYSCGDNCLNCNLLEAGKTQIYYFKTELKDLNLVSVNYQGCLLDKKEINKC